MHNCLHYVHITIHITSLCDVYFYITSHRNVSHILLACILFYHSVQMQIKTIALKIIVYPIVKFVTTLVIYNLFHVIWIVLVIMESMMIPV